MVVFGRPYALFGEKWIAGVRFFWVYRLTEDDFVLKQISDAELNDPGYRA